MTTLAEELDAIAAETRFSGVVRVDRAGETLERAYGLAQRGERIANASGTRFALASGAKGFTALAVMSLVEDGTLALSTPARALLGGDLPLVGDDVTVEHLLAHRSGIGDYLDEDLELDLDAYLMPVPVHELATTEDYVAILDGFPPKFAPGERFAYCNGGYVILALLAERASGVPYRELVAQRVCERAGLRDTAFLRSDELPGGVALGYLAADGLRTNVLHLPVRGTGDGGIYSTVADIRALWGAFLGGRIVSPSTVEEMTRPRSEGHGKRYGLGFWLHATRDHVRLVGSDTGVSFWSSHAPAEDATYTVVSNVTDAAWPLADCLERHAA